MRFLYVDNYRGFTSTYIPILDVNFFVGENSTGKSSILNLIELLGTPEFWFTQDFNNDEVELGVFRDIVSATSVNNKSFQVGVIECDDQAEFPTSRQRTFLMTFIENKGLPMLKDFSFIKNDKQFRVAFGRKLTRYMISSITPLEDLQTTLMSVFKSWVENSAGTGKGYKTLKPKDIRPRQRGNLVLIKNILLQIAGKMSDEETELNFFEIDIPTFSQHLVWIAPVRSKPSRIYGGYKTVYTPEGEHTPLLIKELLSREKSAEDFGVFAEEFGKESGLFEDIYIKNFGKTFTSPFELGVNINGNSLRISDVGYGVSQSLPIIVELFARQDGSWFALQQPEVHLHPKAQASLGNLFMDLATKSDQRFFIETHSDYMIDRFRTCYRDSDHKISCQVIFFERCSSGNIIHPIPILEDGNYSDQQPNSFREFFINEELRVLGL